VTTTSRVQAQVSAAHEGPAITLATSSGEVARIVHPELNANRLPRTHSLAGMMLARRAAAPPPELGTGPVSCLRKQRLTRDGQRAGGGGKIRSISARSAAVGIHFEAAAFAFTCLGVIAPAITDEQPGRAASAPKATSSAVPRAPGPARCRP
jgi:hypothetical protein